MVAIHHLASKICNASKAYHAKTCVPLSRVNENILSVLQKEGLIAGVAKGSTLGPHVDVAPTTNRTVDELHALTPVSERRLWVDMKYVNGRPVLSDFHVISKPSHRRYATVEEIKRVLNGKERRGWRYGDLLGAVTLVSTRQGIVSAPEALKLNMGGEVMAICY